MRVWGKIWKDGHLIRDMVAEEPGSDTRTHKILRALEEICHAFDLPVPIWLDSNIAEFQRTSKTRFTADSFVEEIGFDCLELQVIEE